MPVPQPSQYQIDNMEQGDIVFVRKPRLSYRLYRKFFLNKPKIKVRQYWNVPEEYNIYYQEDCTLLYRFELKCVQKYDNEVVAVIGINEGKKTLKTTILKELQVGLYNIMLVFDSGLTISIPTDQINDGARKNQRILKQDEDLRALTEVMKYQKHTGDYFKKYAQEHTISRWVPAYCSVCGNPVVFNFEENRVRIDNKCDCGEIKLEKKEFSYDEFSIWYYNQTSEIIKKRYNEFWFKKE